MLQKPDLGYSGYFDGSTSGIDVAAMQTTSFAAGNFCIEFWFYPTNPAGGQQTIAAKRTNNASYDFIIGINQTASKVHYYCGGGPYYSAGTFRPYAWNHVALIRSGTSHFLMLNGSMSTSVQTGIPSYVSTNHIHIGYEYPNTGVRFFYQGWLSDFHITVGTSKYADAGVFPPPNYTLPRTRIIPDATYSKLLLLANANNTDLSPSAYTYAYYSGAVPMYSTAPDDYIANANTLSGLTITGTDILSGTNYMTKEALMKHYPQIFDKFKSTNLYVWGKNSTGGLGDGTSTQQNVPTKALTTNGAVVYDVVVGVTGRSVGGLGDADAYATLRSNSVNATVATNMFTWGDNADGTMNNGAQGGTYSSPVITTTSLNWKYVSGSANSHMFGAINDGAGLYAWGHNQATYGSLGINSATESWQTTPALILNSTDQFSMGDTHGGAVYTGGLAMWGGNDYGELGFGDTTARPTVTQLAGVTYGQVACGENISAAVKRNGTLYTWGRNDQGQLGLGDTVNRSSPTQIMINTLNWKSVACGSGMMCAISKNGSLWTWGRNLYGQLGQNSSVASTSTPAQIFGGGTDWKFVSCGVNFTGGLKTDGSLWTWGRNNFGQLGVGDTTNRSSPVQVFMSGTYWQSIACGSASMVGIQDNTDNF